jgi:arylsulfatase A-like enzyme
MMWVMMGCWDSSAPIPEPTPKVTPPSVLVISLDTVSAEHLSLYGGPAKVPHMESFAQSATTFDQAISHFPETALSHWSLMTGVLPEVHGNVPATGDSRYTGPTLAERWSSAGYKTAAFIGGETLTNRSTGLARGFHTYDDQYPWDRKDLKRPGQEVVASASAWMAEREHSNQAFFAFVHLFDAHFPYTPSPPWDTAYATGYSGTLTGSDADLRPYRDGQKTPSTEEIAHIASLYDGEISELDAIIAPLLHQTRGKNMYVVITSDHGESFRHNYWFNHRDGLWDEVTRVPLLISGPKIPKNERRHGVVGLVDVAPTLLALTGADPFEDSHGSDLGPLLKGAETERKRVFSITDPWRESPQFSVRDSDHRMIASMDRGMPKLETARVYDLAIDPLESNGENPVPEAFESIGATYQASVQKMSAKWQGPKPKPRTPSGPEFERLKALGYVD